MPKIIKSVADVENLTRGEKSHSGHSARAAKKTSRRDTARDVAGAAITYVPILPEDAGDAERLRIVYVPLSVAQRWDRNPKLHDMGGIIRSIERYGFKDAARLDKALDPKNPLGAISAGNGRITALMQMKMNRRPAPRGIKVKDDEWYVPFQIGVEARNLDEAVAFALDHNNLTLMGGDFTAFDAARMWETEKYTELLALLATHDAMPVTVDGDDLDALIHGKERDVSEDGDAGENSKGNRVIVCPHCQQEIELDADGNPVGGGIVVNEDAE